MRTIAVSLLCLFIAGAIEGQVENTLPPPAATRLPRPSATADDETAARRLRVATLIAEGAAAAPKALQLLESKEAAERAAGIFVLASIGAKSAAPGIVNALATDRSDVVRVQAAEALGALGTTESIGALIRAADTDRNDHVRLRAIASLCRIESPKVITPLRRYVRSPRNDAELQVAFIAAGRRRIAALEPDLIAACTDVAQPDHVRGAAVLALGLMAGPDANDTITRMMRDTSAVVRFNAVSAVDDTRNKAAADEVVRVFANASEETYVRIRAASALANLGTTESLEALQRMAEGADELMAMHSVVALSQADAPHARTLAKALRARARDPFVIHIADRVASGRSIPWGQR